MTKPQFLPDPALIAQEIRKASQGDDSYFYSHAESLIEQIQLNATQATLNEIERRAGGSSIKGKYGWAVNDIRRELSKMNYESE